MCGKDYRDYFRENSGAAIRRADEDEAWQQRSARNRRIVVCREIAGVFG